jgi:MOSC domain-containing protein YiiM
MAVDTEGDVGAGDEVSLRGRDANAVSVSEITRLYTVKEYGIEDARKVRRALKVDALPDSWKEYFQEKLNRLGV